MRDILFNMTIFLLSFYFISCSQEKKSILKTKDFEIHNTLNTGLPDDNITALTSDKFGNIWVGTEFGLSKFDGNTWLGYDIGPVHLLAVDSNNNIWIFISEGGPGRLSEFNGTEFTIFHELNSALPSTEIRIMDIICDKNGFVWIATDEGLIAFDGKKWKNYNSSNSEIPNSYIRSLSVDVTGNLWLIDDSGNLVKFNGNNFEKIHRFDYSMIGSPLIFDNNNNVYFGIRNGFYGRYNLEEQKNYYHEIFGANATDMVCDNLGTAWISTSGHGLIRMSKGRIKRRYSNIPKYLNCLTFGSVPS